MKKTTFILSISIIMLSSCMTTKTTIGEFKEQTEKKYTYSKGKQVYIFWGTIPLGRTDLKTPKDKNCQIVTRFNITDALISGITLGVITSYTIKIKAKK